MAKTTKVQGTKFRISVGREAQKAITAINLNTATLTIASSGYEKGDAIELTGCGQLDGIYPVLSVTGDQVKLCEEVKWEGKDLPTSYTKAKAALVQFSEQFCAVKNIEKSNDTLNTEDVTTVCSEGTETEPGEIEFGSIKLSFFHKPTTEMQARLRELFFNKSTFAYKLELPDNHGTTYGVGFIESGNGFSGEVKGKYEGSVSIKPSKRDYLLV
ncbi:hypothetical protein [Mannheimia indoligenes]|uniref:hypothetical protein n=1 Tax=Mannheimia indoligenes TaxID=3103145 RepID=UPI002FE575D9